MRRLLATYLILLIFPAVTQAQMTINLNARAGMNANAIAGFQAAADYWESVIDDNISVNIDIDYDELEEGVLGSAGSSTQVSLISSYFTALGNDITSGNDATAVANLPSLNFDRLAFRTQKNTEAATLAERQVVSLDDDLFQPEANNNLYLSLNTANAKALGIWSGTSTRDATIIFSDQYMWDFDQSDGIGAGLQDFVGVAVHEIGHALGFRSGVDSVDGEIKAGLGEDSDLDGFAVFSGWDMFRYSSDDGILDLSAGTASYFSIDGGSTNLGLMSTGVTQGDTRQASHWKDGLGLGIMDPTAQLPGNLNVVTALDLMAFDVMGYNLSAVPEPTSMLTFAITMGLISRRRRRVA